ncbi:MAG: hypothetical protein A4E70_02560 [Syntrophus sp. PtaU1.Bin005]|nr:MAG: hypothetical protein A4E70_02560 [Syntrophus sp. PtaU1.Bin005]
MGKKIFGSEGEIDKAILGAESKQEIQCGIWIQDQDKGLFLKKRPQADGHFFRRRGLMERFF